MNCNKCGQPIDDERSMRVANVATATFQHVKCRDVCPDCLCFVTFHNDKGCTAPQNTGLIHRACPCTRTYESLVGENDGTCKRCGGVFNQRIACSCDLGGISAKLDCVCQSWPGQADWISGHHPNCDGTGGVYDGQLPIFDMKYEEQMETELQLLVIDMGESCVVKVEKGRACDINFGDDRNEIAYSGLLTVVYAPFTELREAIDGEKPVFSVKLDEGDSLSEHYIVDAEGKTVISGLTTNNIDAIAHIRGEAFPVYKPTGEWEEVGHIDDHVYNNTDLRVWRYKSNA